VNHLSVDETRDMWGRIPSDEPNVRNDIRQAYLDLPKLNDATPKEIDHIKAIMPPQPTKSVTIKKT